MSLDSVSISAWSAVFSCITSFVTAWIAWRAFRFTEQIEKGRSSAILNEHLIHSINSLLVSFSKLQVVAMDEWSDDRSERLRVLSKELQQAIRMVSSLDYEVGEKVKDWEVSKNFESNSIPSVIYYVLGQNGASIGDSYGAFFMQKSIELQAIRSSLISS